jgi:hypothetical protein
MVPESGRRSRGGSEEEVDTFDGMVRFLEYGVLLRWVLGASVWKGESDDGFDPRTVGRAWVVVEGIESRERATRLKLSTIVGCVNFMGDDVLQREVMRINIYSCCSLMRLMQS